MKIVEMNGHSVIIENTKNGTLVKIRNGYGELVDKCLLCDEEGISMEDAIQYAKNKLAYICA